MAGKFQSYVGSLSGIDGVLVGGIGQVSWWCQACCHWRDLSLVVFEVVLVVGEQATQACRNFNLCAGLKAGIKGAIHAIWQESLDAIKISQSNSQLLSQGAKPLRCCQSENQPLIRLQILKTVENKKFFEELFYKKFKFP